MRMVDWPLMISVVVLSCASLNAEVVRVEIEAPTIGLIFQPREFAVRPGQEVELVFRNTGQAMVHNLLIVEPGAADEVAQLALELGGEGPARHWVPATPSVLHATDTVEGGDSRTLRFTAPEVEGVYPYVCTIPGHAQTMRGRMHVTTDEQRLAPPRRDDDDGEDEPGKPEQALRYERMDTGPFYSGVITAGDATLDKGLTLRLGEHGHAAMHFDTDLLRVSAAWTGAGLEFHAEHDYGVRNDPPPSAAGEIQFTSSARAGWRRTRDERFTDPRPRPFGPMPSPHGRYRGVYLRGDRAVLHYELHDTTIYESPWYVHEGELDAFVRDVRVEAMDEPLVMMLFEAAGEMVTERRKGLRVLRSEDQGQVTVAAIDAEVAARFETSGPHAALRIDEAKPLRVLLWSGPAEQLDAWLALAGAHARPSDVQRLTEPGGPRRWSSLTTRGRLDETDAPYVVDRLPGPTDNPYNAVLHLTGLTFDEDERALVTTIHGDVWRVDGIDDELAELTWTRFATGLNSPFGVRVVDGRVHVACEDELIVLHDRAGDGEADHYETLANLIAPGAGAWRQAFGLEVDDEGYFYFARGRGRRGSGLENGIIRVSPDGREMELIATGFRQPWAIGLSPDGRITTSQQEGPWTPQTRVDKVDLQSRQASFYGAFPGRFRDDDYPRQRGYEAPLIWLPRHVDNSGAGQVWVESDHWGLPHGTMLHISGGQSMLMALLHERVDGERQAAAVPLTRIRHSWGARTGAFNPVDGQLYIVALSPQAALRRIRHTGRPVHVPVAIAAHANGVRLRFNHGVDGDALDPARFTIHRWQYRWSGDYGSDFYSIERPSELGLDVVDVASVTVVEQVDGAVRELFVEIPDMKPAMQMRLRYELVAADGTPMAEDLYTTVHALRPAWQGH